MKFFITLLLAFGNLGSARSLKGCFLKSYELWQAGFTSESVPEGLGWVDECFFVFEDYLDESSYKAVRLVIGSLNRLYRIYDYKATAKRIQLLVMLAVDIYTSYSKDGKLHYGFADITNEENIVKYLDQMLLNDKKTTKMIWDFLKKIASEGLECFSDFYESLKSSHYWQKTKKFFTGNSYFQGYGFFGDLRKRNSDL